MKKQQTKLYLMRNETKNYDNHFKNQALRRKISNIRRIEKGKAVSFWSQENVKI